MSDKIGELLGDKQAVLVPGLPFADYCDLPAVNISTLLQFVGRTDYGAKWKIDHPSTETESLLIGHAAHAAILEPAVFAALYSSQPDFGDLRTKAAKELRDAWLAANAGKVSLPANDAAHVKAMKAAIDACRDPEIREMFDGPGQNELTIIWREQITGLGLICKARIDRLTTLHGYSVIIDLKTDKGITSRELATSIGEYNYHARMAWYMDAMDIAKKAINPAAPPTDWLAVWVWLMKPAIDTKTGVAKEAYEVRATQCDESAFTEGRALYRHCFDRYSECVKSGKWSSFPNGIDVVNPPIWAFKFTKPE